MTLPPAVPSVETTEAVGDQTTTQAVLGEGGEAITVQPADGAEGVAEFSEIPPATPAITEQPLAVEEPAVEPPKNPWSHSLFGCFGMDT